MEVTAITDSMTLLDICDFFYFSRQQLEVGLRAPALLQLGMDGWTLQAPALQLKG